LSGLEEAVGGFDLARSMALLRWVLMAFLTPVPAYGFWQLWFGTLHAPTLDTRRVIVRDHTGKIRPELGCDDYLPDAFRSKYNPGVLFFSTTRPAPCAATCTPATS
jgi:hypothetical protein